VAEFEDGYKSKEVVSILWTGVIIQFFMSILGLAIIISLALPLTHEILQINQEIIEESTISFYIMALSIPAILISNSFRGFLEAFQRFDFVNLVRTPLNMSVFLAPLFGAVVGWKLPEIICIITICKYLGLCEYIFLSSKVQPALLTINNLKLNSGKIKLLLGFGKWVTISSVIGPVLIYIDRFVIGSLISASAVAFYSVPHEMITRLSIISMSLVSTLFPAFSNLHSIGKKGVISDLISKSLKYILILLGPLIISITFFSEKILLLWLGEEFSDRSTLVFQVLAVGILVNSLAFIPFYLIRAIGRPDIPAKFHMLELPAYILLVLASIKSYGIQGAALSWTIRVTIDAVLLYIAACKMHLFNFSYFVNEKIHKLLLLLVCMSMILLALSLIELDFLPRCLFLLIILLSFYFVAWFRLIKKV